MSCLSLRSLAGFPPPAFSKTGGAGSTMDLFPREEPFRFLIFFFSPEWYITRSLAAWLFAQKSSYPTKRAAACTEHDVQLSLQAPRSATTTCYAQSSSRKAVLLFAKVPPTKETRTARHTFGGGENDSLSGGRTRPRSGEVGFSLPVQPSRFTLSGVLPRTPNLQCAPPIC